MKRYESKFTEAKVIGARAFYNMLFKKGFILRGAYI